MNTVFWCTEHDVAWLDFTFPRLVMIKHIIVLRCGFIRTVSDITKHSKQWINWEANSVKSLFHDLGPVNWSHRSYNLTPVVYFTVRLSFQPMTHWTPILKNLFMKYLSIFWRVYNKFGPSVWIIWRVAAVYIYILHTFLKILCVDFIEIRKVLKISLYYTDQSDVWTIWYEVLCIRYNGWIYKMKNLRSVNQHTYTYYLSEIWYFKHCNCSDVIKSSIHSS